MLLNIPAAWGESLWIPGFRGYLSSELLLNEGDVVIVEIESSSALDFKASSSDSKSMTLEYSGGGFGDLFAFLPDLRSSGDFNLKGKGELKLRASIAAQVVETDSFGKARIQGSREIAVNGMEESLSLSGWVDPYLLGAERKVSFSQLLDGRLKFSTLLDSSSTTLSQEDIEEIVEELQAEALPAAAAEAAVAGATVTAAAEGVASAAAAAGTVAAVPAEAGGTPAVTFSLSDAKKKELFLRYLNRMIDLIFQ